MIKSSGWQNGGRKSQWGRVQQNKYISVILFFSCYSRKNVLILWSLLIEKGSFAGIKVLSVKFSRVLKQTLQTCWCWGNEPNLRGTVHKLSLSMSYLILELSNLPLAGSIVLYMVQHYLGISQQSLGSFQVLPQTLLSFYVPASHLKKKHNSCFSSFLDI